MGDVVFTNFNDECRCGSCTDNVALRKNQRRDFDGWESEKALGEEQRLLCPPRVLGYHLSTRTWLEMFVEGIIEIKKPESDLQFTKLQLEDTHKDLIRDLVQGHVSGTDKAPLMKDFVAGKGQGLVILLHGPPGVGKVSQPEHKKCNHA
jgi:ATP-dependent Lon protease